VLNMLSTISMIKIGKVYKNIMVDMIPSNAKLVNRALGQIMTLTGVDAATAEKALRESGNHVKTAVLMIKRGLSAEAAKQLLAESEDNLRQALSRTGI